MATFVNENVLRETYRVRQVGEPTRSRSRMSSLCCDGMGTVLRECRDEEIYREL
jgi:hypothetical protein